MAFPLVALVFSAAVSLPQPEVPEAARPLCEPPVVAFALEPTPSLVSPLTLASRTITGTPAPGRKPRREKQASESKPRSAEPALGPERARILLRSLTVPGWGQASLGHRTSAKVFLLAELGAWGAFTAFRMQQAMRTDTYLRTARIEAGIDLADVDDEMRKIVGSYASSAEYNLLVVTRDAANLYLSDPDPSNWDLPGYRAYIADHSIGGDLAWAWSGESAFRRYGEQRRFALKAGLRANAALGVAVANRILSALHVSRLSAREAKGAPQGWHFELQPGVEDPGAVRAAFATSF